MSDPLRILNVGEPLLDVDASAWGPFVVTACATLAEAAQLLRDAPPDAVLLRMQAGDPSSLTDWPALSHAVLDAAVVVVTSDPAAAVTVAWLQLGVQDVLGSDEATAGRLARVLRLAVERKRIDRAARRAFATDLATGLPNHAQLLEHLTHLFALREREPAPMALIALRIEGLAATAAALGPEAANVLRRKVAVRLRAGLRASDVVAAVGADSFVVLLAWIDAPEDGPRVAAKLAAALRRPFAVAGREQRVAVSLGLALYPVHGKEPEALLRRALAQAASATAAAGAAGGAAVERSGSAAANDD
jgi:diguanylate cyclase (GGDEF)-like protein